jgi:mono/diheme cytochrome c family protein
MKIISNKFNLIFGFAILGLIYILSSCIQEPPAGSLAAQATKGKVHFMKYCSPCHGSEGKGVQVDSLTKQPADLTLITSSYRTGKFPILEVAQMIDGRNMAKSHGTRQMPVWGEVFSEQEHLDESQIKGKLGEIIAYLMTIQGK